VLKYGEVRSSYFGIGNSLEGGNCVANWLQIADHGSFGTLAFENGLEYLNFDYSS